MDLITFEKILEAESAKFEYVTSIEIKQRTPISLSGSIGFTKNYSLAVFYNQLFDIFSFSLIYQNNRVWGLDKDNRIGWHIHPVENPNNHIETSEKTINEIISIVNEVFNKLTNNEIH